MSFNEDKYHTSGLSFNPTGNRGMLNGIKNKSGKPSPFKNPNVPEVPKGYHVMPDGSIMADALHKMMCGGTVHGKLKCGGKVHKMENGDEVVKGTPVRKSGLLPMGPYDLKDPFEGVRTPVITEEMWQQGTERGFSKNYPSPYLGRTPLPRANYRVDEDALYDEALKTGDYSKVEALQNLKYTDPRYSTDSGELVGPTVAELNPYAYQQWQLEQKKNGGLVKMPNGGDTDYFKLSPISSFGQTPGLHTYGDHRLTMDATFGRRNIAPRLAQRQGFESIGTSLTARLPYQNNTGVGVQGGVNFVGDRWDLTEGTGVKTNVEADLTGGYDPNLGGYASLMAGPQFTFGNVAPTVAKVYGNQLREGEWLAKAGPYAGAGWTPGREKVEERFNIPAGVRGQFNVGLGGGKTLGASGYFGGDLFGQASSVEGDPSGLIGRTQYGFDINLTLPFGAKQKKSIKELGERLTKAYPKEESTPPSIASRGRSSAKFLKEGGEVMELTDEEIQKLREGGAIVVEY